MKKLYVSVLAVLACLSSFAQTASITTTAKNGSWTNKAHWNPATGANRIPADNDVIDIASGAKTTIASNDPIITLNNVTIRVYGTLVVNSQLVLNGNSWEIEVIGGSIQGSGSINVSSSGSATNTTIFNGTSTVTGNKIASYNSPNFQTPIPLPVKFTGFSVTRQNSDVLVQWSTSEELNAENYYVERSFDGANWATIATVASQGNTSSLTHYFHLDKHVTAAIAYYRIKQVDLDGQYTYTAIRSVKSAGGALAVNVAAINNRVVLQFSAPVKGSVEVRLVSLAGQVVSKQIISNPVGQVVLNNSALKGSYIVTISNAADINVAKQVVL